jgi:hypothetical protein
VNAARGLAPSLALLGALASGPVDDAGHLDPAAFAFVEPGVSRAEVDRRLGPPYISSPSVVAAGEIDLFIDGVSIGSSRGRQPRQTEEVHYYDYRPDAHPSK